MKDTLLIGDIIHINAKIGVFLEFADFFLYLFPFLSSQAIGSVTSTEYPATRLFLGYYPV